MTTPFLGLLLASAVLPSFVRAEDGAAEALRVVRPLVHSEQEQAEFCLEFDRGLETVGATARNIASLQLEMEGKSVAVSGRNVSLGGNQLCISGLEHRKNYHLSLGALRDDKGEKISRPYSLTFTVPARHPSLTFVSKEIRDGMTVGRDNPILNSVNTSKVNLELYRIIDPAKMTEAWNQRLQTTLAPSESLYFARHNGTLVAQKQIKPDRAPDNNAISKIDFFGSEAAPLPPGLYLVAAVSADEKPAKEDTSRDEQDKENALTPTAAAWLLRSDLKLQALRDDAAFRVLTENVDASAILTNIHVILMDRDQHSLAEARSDVGGQASLLPKAGKDDDAQSVIGLSDRGDVAFFDLARAAALNPVLPSMAASLLTDQAVYAPGDSISVTVTARDLHKHAVSLKGSSLQFLRPDRSVYDSLPVSLDANGSAKMSFPAPALSGLCHLVWKQEDGQDLAAADLRLSSNPVAPLLNFTADRAALASDGGINLAIRSQTAARTPAPFIAGHAELVWEKADHPFPAWKDFSFDDGRKVDSSVVTLASFITDQNGDARLNLTLPADDNDPLLRQAELRIVSDPSYGALDPDPLHVPVKPAGIVVGIKPQISKGHFPENSLARFDVVALDGEGQQHARDDLTYQIYEQGRRFDWYQSESHWDYKPEQQRRRIGGGGLSFGDNNQGVIEWPVTSGAYQLEITDADDHLLARQDFNAGWGYTEKEKSEVAALALKATPAVLQKDVPEKINFTLPHAALVTATIADDRLRAVVHVNDPAGANSVTFTPLADWGDRVTVRIQARFSGTEGDGGEALGQSILSSVEATASSSQRANPKPAMGVYPPPAADLTLNEVSHQWLDPQQTYNQAENKARPDVASMIFMAPEPFYAAPHLLAAQVGQHPFLTKDIATHLDVFNLWHDVILGANLLPEAALRARRNETLTKLLGRQNADGGFAPLPLGSSDIASTAAAVESFAALDDVPARPALEQAVRWLHHRLENTWFNEQERSERATAYAALARAGKLDLASLHYFSDTSADKPLSVLAEAQIAYAFASINDRPASEFWLDKVRNRGAAQPDMSSEELSVLLANPFFAQKEVEDSLDKASKAASLKAEDSGVTGNFLSAVGRSEDRAGDWHAVIGKDDKKLHGVFVLPISDKTVPALRNSTSGHPVYVALINAAKAHADKNSVQRRIYSLDGSEASRGLDRGATYLLTLEGPWPGKQPDTMTVHVDADAALMPVTCAIETPGIDSFLGWLLKKEPTPVKACERDASGLDVLIERGEKPLNVWRIAYLATASGGGINQLRPAAASLGFIAPNPDDKGDRH